MALQFIPAVKKALKGRMAIIGPTGSGKTYTALAIATAMCKKVAVADTESANPTSTASCGAATSRANTAADRTGIAWRRRPASWPGPTFPTRSSRLREKRST